MPTHEIISGITPVDGTVPDAWILKCEDPAEVRFARWEKDRVILEAWLMKNPDNHRGLYYLAQTCECLSQSPTKTEEERRGLKLRAVSLYMRRSELGGWQDEVFESCMRAGNLLEQLGNRWADAQELFLQAFKHAPYRAEPLAKIAQHWLDNNSPAVAYPFALRAFDIPVPPPGPVSPNSHLYQTSIPDLLSRSAFYVGQKAVGRVAAKKAALSLPDSMNLRRNYHFYTPTLKEIVGARYRDIDIAPPLDAGWVSTTPSVCVTDGDRRAIIRTVNYKIKLDGSYDYDGTIRTRNYFVSLNPDFTLASYKEIHDRTNVPRTDFPVHGFEDCRLFHWQGSYWALCTACDLEHPKGKGMREQVLLKLSNQYDTWNQDDTWCVQELTPIRGSWSDQHQKNWKPVVDGDQLRLVYSTDPLCVIDYGTTDAQTKHSGRMLGSSQAVKIAEGWLWVDHEVSTNSNGRERVYVHRFVLANAELSHIIGTSDPFYFENLGIEFCAGLAITSSNDLVLSYSVHDESSKIAVVPLGVATEMVSRKEIGSAH